MILIFLRSFCLFIPILLLALSSYQNHPVHACFLLISFIGNCIAEFLHIHHVWLVFAFYCRESISFRHYHCEIRVHPIIWKVFVLQPSFQELSTRICFLLHLYTVIVFSWYGLWVIPSFVHSSPEILPFSSFTIL